MKRRLLALFMATVIGISLPACGENQKPADTPPESAVSAEKTQTFPYQDDEGRTRYRLLINGKEVVTENFPFTYPDDAKCGYYPLEDVLTVIGVESLRSPDDSALTTKINGKVLKVSAGVKEMTYGSKTINGFGAEAPVCVDDCLYVPSFLFMFIFDNGIVDFSGDRSAATLDTNTTINLAASGPAGLSIPNTVAGSSGNVTAGNGSGASKPPSGSATCGTCNGSGHSICTYCGGTGNKLEYQQTYDPISKQYKQTQRTVRCPRCGGSGRVTCPACGGTGKR